MKKPTAAGMKILRTFEKRPTDPFDINILKYEQMLIRSRLRSVNLYRSVDKLKTDGFLNMEFTHSGRLFSLTDAGRAALSTPTTQP